MKRIKIDHNGWGRWFYEIDATDSCASSVENIGLKQLKRGYGRLFNVVNEKVFMLAVIKYGLIFKEVDKNHKEKF